MDLSGRWRAHAAEETLTRVFSDVDHDDASWSELAVPGHWRSAPEFADHDGPVLYRRHFDLEAPTPGRRAWLVFDGVFYLGDVWLDGSYVGNTEGYFFPHSFDVTDAARAASEHVLAVEVACAPQTDRTHKRQLTGVFQHWDCLDPDWNPGGIWQPVRIEETGAVRIRRLSALCTEATEETATLAFRAVLDAVEQEMVTLRTAVGEVRHEARHSLAAGENRIEWNVTVEGPSLWWPRALGDQPLYDVDVEVLDEAGVSSHRRQFRTGLRQVRTDKWHFEVNGERLFLKGTNHGPTRMALAEATPDELAGDVQLALDANLDVLRVHAHVTRRELYDAADAAGLLLWQDLPLQWGYARSVRKQATRQAREAVDLLGHHPSIAIWCAHNEPAAVDIEPRLERPKPRVAARAVAGLVLPTWNKNALDLRLHRVLEKADRSRPVIPHSGVPPHPGSGGTDSHLYFGWYHGEEDGLAPFLAAWPRMARFVSEFGAQAVPDVADFMEPERWPDLAWDRLARHHALQKWVFDRRVPPSDYDSFDGWRRATQEYQARLIKRQVEALRLLKYRPTGGFCQFCFGDAMPAVSWSVLDDRRVPKLGFAALRNACQPVIVVASQLADRVRPGEALAVDVHVVNDLRRSVDGQVRAVLSWDGGSQSWAWAGDVPADDCVRVGTIQAVVPAAGGPLTLDLELTGNANAANTYLSEVSS
jgi:beta-mannosidase